MDEYNEIISREFGDEQERAMENMHAFHTLLDFIVSSADSMERKNQALRVLNAMNARLDHAVNMILKG